MSVNLAREIRPADSSKMKRKRRPLWRSWWLSFPVLILLLIAVVSLAAWSLWRSPTILAPRIEHALATKGIQADITDLAFQQANTCGVNKNLCIRAEVSSLTLTGASLKNLQANVVTAPVKTWASIQQPEITSVELVVDELTLSPAFNTNQANETSADSTTQSLQAMLNDVLMPIKSQLPERASVKIKRLRVTGEEHAATVFATLDNAQGQDLSLMLDVVDDRLGQLNGEIRPEQGYASLNILAFDLSPWIHQPINVQSFALDADLKKIYGNAIAAQDFSGVSGTGMVRYDDLNVQVSVTGHKQRIDIDATPLSATTNLSPISLSVTKLPFLSTTEVSHVVPKSPSANNQRAVLPQNSLALTINALPLSALSVLKPFLPNAELIPRELSGNLTGDVFVDFRDGISLLGTTLDVENLAGADDIARFDRLGVSVQIDEQNVYLQANFDESRFDIPALFPVRGQTFTGIAFVRFNTKEQVLIIDDASLSNSDFDEINVFGEVKLADTSQVTLNDLNVEIVAFQATSLIDYVARKNVSKGFYDWLDQAFMAGDISGKVYLNGAINGFFVSDNFTFDTDFQLGRFKLSYLANNPPLAMSLGQLKLKNKQLNVTTTSGNITGVPVRGRVTIQDILQPVLEVDLTVPPTDVQTLANTAGKSLAKPAVDKVTAYLNLAGQASMNFALNYDLVDNQFGFDIVLKPHNTRVQAKGFQSLPVTNATGEIVISEKGFQHMSLSGKVAGQPLHADIHSTTNADGVIETTGKIDVVVEPLRFVRSIPGQEKLARAIKNSAAIQGKAPFVAEFFMQGAELKTLTATSDLVGAEVRLFDILQKRRRDKVPLSVDYRGDFGELSIDLQDRMAIKATLANGQLTSLSMTDETDVPVYAEDGQIVVSLHPEQVDVNQVLAFANAFGTGKSSKQSSPFDIRTDVSANTVRYGAFSLDNVSVSGDLNSGLQLDSDLLKGFVQMRDGDITGHIERVSVDELLAQLQQASKTNATTRDKPSSKEKKSPTHASKVDKALPSVTVNIDQFIYRGVNLGEASLRLTTKNGLNAIENLHVTGDGFFINVTGFEQRSDNVSSTLSGTLRVNDLGSQLAPFLTQGTIHVDQIDGDFSLSYAGRLPSIAMDKLVGELTLRAVNVSSDELAMPPSGVLKLIDWESLARRIRLDLDIDLWSLSFDTIVGKLSLNHDMLTVKKLQAKTALADIRAKGDINLSTRKFAGFIVTVRPKPSNLLPVIGAVASGGTGFAVGLAVDVVAGHPINQILRLTYQLSGALDTPKISSEVDTRIETQDEQSENAASDEVDTTLQDERGNKER